MAAADPTSVAVPAVLADTPAASLRFRQGMLLYSQKKWEDAAEQFGAVLQQMNELHGEVHPPNAPLYYWYGKCLLQQFQAMHGVFGLAGGKSAAQGDDDDDEEEGDEEEDDDTEDDAEDGEQDDGGDDAAAGADGDAANGDKGDDIDAETKAAIEKAMAENGDAEDAESLGGDLDELTEITWETLDVARALLQKDPSCGKDKEHDLLLASTFASLAELSMDNDNFDAAYSDFQSCLEIRTKYLPASSQLLADTHTTMATAQLMQASTTKDETQRSTLLQQTCEHYGQASHSLILRLKDLATAAGLNGFVEKLDALLSSPDNLIFAAQNDRRKAATRIGMPSVGFAGTAKTVVALLTENSSVKQDDTSDIMELASLVDELGEKILEVTSDDPTAKDAVQEALRHLRGEAPPAAADAPAGASAAAAPAPAPAAVTTTGFGPVSAEVAAQAAAAAPLSSRRKGAAPQRAPAAAPEAEKRKTEADTSSPSKKQRTAQ